MSDTQFNQHVAIDTTPMPDHIPKVKEIEAHGRGEFDCMKEGRKVTRCAASVIQDINDKCLQSFRDHWNCLENRNHQLYQCRRAERALNECVFDKIGLQKELPDTPPGETPVHLRKKQIYAVMPQGDLEDRWTYRTQVREQEQIQYHVGRAMKELQEMKAISRAAETSASKVDTNGKASS